VGRWIFWAKFLLIFSVWGKCVFAGVFAEIGVLDVVFLWTECGEMRDKDGLWMCGFREPEFCSFWGFIGFFRTFGEAPLFVLGSRQIGSMRH
jgi:hypothetical protein